MEQLSGRRGYRWVIFAGCVVIFLFCVMGIFGLSVYRFQWDNGFTRTLTCVLPLPAALANGDMVTMCSWRDEVEAVARFSQKRLNKVDRPQIEKDVLEKMIKEVLLKKLARREGVKVVLTDIADFIAKTEQDAGGKEAFEKYVTESFGWDMKKFTDKMIYPEVLWQKTTAVSPKADRRAKAEAEDVLRALKKGKAFADAAKEFSDDTGSAAAGGDLGWFPRGVMVKEFEQAAFALEKGQTSGLVRTDFGYHIIFLEDKKAAEEGKPDSEQVKASHILVKFQPFSELWQEYLDKAKVYKFVAQDEK